MAAMPNKTDHQIQQDVLRELEWDPRVRETEIGVQIQDGVVTLTGTVDSWAKKVAAKDAAHRVIGVLDVANDIRVHRPGEKKTDTEIATAVRRALEWDAFVPDGCIETTVSDGVVLLEGTVEHAHQREDAMRVVENLQGVVSVANHIEVVPSPADLVTVRRHIEDALERRAAREARAIEVSIEDGIVRLRGKVRSWAEKRTVIGAAVGTRGVARVVDEIEIDPSF